MLTSHKILIFIGVVYLLAASMFTYAAPLPEVQAITDSVQTITDSVNSLEVRILEAQQPKTTYQGSDLYEAYQVNGVLVNSVPCADLAKPLPFVYCYELTPLLNITP